MAVCFSNEDKKEVFDFFVDILKIFDDFVYYEYIRGHVSKAPPIVKKYVSKHCKGEKLLDYFKKRRNYFTVDKYYVALRNWKKRSCSENGPSLDEAKENGSTLVKKQNDNILVKNRNRNLSESAAEHESYSSVASSRSKEDDEERKEYEDLTLSYFTGFLERHRKAPLDHFDFDTLPKKVKRFLMKNFNKKIRSFFLSFPGHFSLNDDDCVSLSFIPKNEDIPPEDVKGFPPHEAEGIQPIEIPIDPELEKIRNYFEAMKFFVEVLRQKNGFVPIDKLSGYLSQASCTVRDFIKYNYKTFPDFFTDPSVIFQTNIFSEVTLSETYNHSLKRVKKFLKKASEGKIQQSEMTLKSQMDLLLKPRLKTPSNVEDSNVNEISKIQNIADVGCHQKMQSKESIDFDIERNIETSTDVHCISEINKTGNIIANGKKIKLNKSVVTKNEDLEINKSGASANVDEIKIKIDNNVCNNEDISVKITEAIQPDKSNTSKDVFDESSKTCDINDNIFKKRKLVEFIFTVELYCLSSFIEELRNLVTSETLEFFVEILEKHNFSNLTVSRLYGYLGSAPLAVKSFIYKYYKRTKFKHFFKTYDEVFYIKSEFVELCDMHMGTDNMELNKQFYLFMLYLELFSYFYELVKYLHSKGRIKLTRIYNITMKYPHCDNWIKFTDGGSFEEQTVNFLKLFSIFTFNEGYIEYDSRNHSELLLPWLEKSAATYSSATHKEFLPLYVNYLNKLSEIKTGKVDEIEFLDRSVKSETLPVMRELVRNELQSVQYLEYHKLPQILTSEILIDIIKCSENSVFIIENLVDNFDLFSGKITLKKSNTALISKEDMQNCLILNFMEKPFIIKKYFENELKQEQFELADGSHKNMLLSPTEQVSELADGSHKNTLLSQTEQFSSISMTGEAVLEVANNSIEEIKPDDKIMQSSSTEQINPIIKEIATANKELLTGSTNDLKQNLNLPDDILENTLSQTMHSKSVSKSEDAFIKVSKNSLEVFFKLKHKTMQPSSTEQIPTINNKVATEANEPTSLNNDLKQEKPKIPDNIPINDQASLLMQDELSDISEYEDTVVDFANDSLEETKLEVEIMQPLSTEQITLENSEIACNNTDVKIKTTNIQIFENKETSTNVEKENNIQPSMSQNVNETLSILEINNTSTLDHRIDSNTLCSTKRFNEVQDNSTSIQIDEGDISALCDIVCDSKSDATVCHLSNQQIDKGSIENEPIYILCNELQEFLNKDKELSTKTSNKLSQESIKKSSTDNLVKEEENAKEVIATSTETYEEIIKPNLLEDFDMSLNKTKSDSGFEEYVSYFLENRGEGASACSSVIDSSESLSSVLDDNESPVMKISSILANDSENRNSKDEIEMSAAENQNGRSDSKTTQFSYQEYTYLLCHNKSEDLSSAECSENENSFSNNVLSDEGTINSVPENNLSEKDFYNNPPNSSSIEKKDDTHNFETEIVVNEVITVDNCSIDENTLKDTCETTCIPNHNKYYIKDSDTFTEKLYHDKTENLLNIEVSTKEKFITDLLPETETTNSLSKNNSSKTKLFPEPNYINKDITIKKADTSDSSNKQLFINPPKGGISLNSELPSQNNLKKNINNSNESFIGETACLNTNKCKMPNIFDEKDKHVHEIQPLLEKSFDTEDIKILSENTDIEIENDFNFLNVSLNISANNYGDKDIIPSSAHNDNIQSNSSNGNKAFVQQPLQPLIAEIALLTTDSCIAQACIESRLQTIYFLKSVFYCEKHEDCTDCFNLLSVGDKVSCFIPVTEIEHKTWIAFMVSKESISDFERMQSVNDLLLQHQRTNQPIDIQNKRSAKQNCSSNSFNNNENNEESFRMNLIENVPKTECISSNEAADDKCHLLQTKKCYSCINENSNISTKHVGPIFCNTNCQTSPNAHNFSESDKMQEIACQTKNTFFNCITQTTQTDDNFLSKTDSSCQTEITGKIRLLPEVVDRNTQTYSTGQIMITKYSHN